MDMVINKYIMHVRDITVSDHGTSKVTRTPIKSINWHFTVYLWKIFCFVKIWVKIAGVQDGNIRLFQKANHGGHFKSK